MEAVEATKTSGGVEWRGVYPSLFGLYGSLPLDGPETHVDLGVPAVVTMTGGDGATPTLRLTTRDATVSMAIPIASDTEELRNRLISRWMGEHYHTLPSIPLESVLSLLVSQASPTPKPVWQNATIKLHQWEAILCHALEDDDPVVQSARIVEGLAWETDLLSRLRSRPLAGAALLGLEGAMVGAKPESVRVVRRMAQRIAHSPGVLVVAERGHTPEDKEALRNAVPQTGWIAMVGKRPLESYAKEIAGFAKVPAIVLDGDKMKSSPVLDYVDNVMPLGDIEKMGVMRRRAIGMVTASEES